MNEKPTSDEGMNFAVEDNHGFLASFGRYSAFCHPFYRFMDLDFDLSSGNESDDLLDLEIVDATGDPWT